MSKNSVKSRKNSKRSKANKARKSQVAKSVDVEVTHNADIDDIFRITDVDGRFTVELAPVEFQSDGLPSSHPISMQVVGLTGEGVIEVLSEVLAVRAVKVPHLSTQEVWSLLLGPLEVDVPQSVLEQVATNASHSDDPHMRVLAALSGHTPVSVLRTLALDPARMVRFASLTNHHLVHSVTEDDAQWWNSASDMVAEVLHSADCSNSAITLAVDSCNIGFETFAVFCHWVRFNDETKATYRDNNDLWSLIAENQTDDNVWSQPVIELLALEHSRSLNSENHSCDEEAA